MNVRKAKSGSEIPILSVHIHNAHKRMCSTSKKYKSFM